MNYVIAICLAYMLAILAIVTVQLIKASRRERLQQIKNFKRGKFVLIYFAIIPLYFLAYRFNGMAFEASFWSSLKNCLEFVVLKYDYSTVAPLMAENLFYKITVETAFALVLLNAVIFSISFVGQVASNSISLFITRKFRKKIVVVVGDRATGIDILKSIKAVHGKAVLMDKMSTALRDDAYVYRADCVNLSPEDDFGDKIWKLFGKFDKKQVYVILNCEDDAVSLRYAKQLCTLIDDKRLTDLPLTKPYGLQAYAFASKANESAFAHYEEASYGLVRFVNRHEKIATDFIENHPLTEYMTEEQLDYATATVRETVNLNVIMVGFGKINETIFLTSVSNNQFLTIRDGKLQPKAVNYHLYDKNYPAGKIGKENTSILSRSLNHGYMRYSEFLKENADNQKEYLEFAEEPAKIHFHPCDIAHPDFYSSLQATLCDKNAYSYVILSFGTDMENIELAEKLQQKFHEWNIPSFIKIFVKVRDKKLVQAIRDDFAGDLIEFFGTNCDTVYNAAKIIGEEAAEMAKLRHLFYTAESLKRENRELAAEELERLAREKWYYKFKQFQRESNIFACMSIRMKLHLLGYDYAKEGEDVAAEFEAEYEKGNARVPSAWEVNGKKIWNYSNAEQTIGTVRYAYAVQEHQRWNANMICHGLIPSSREEIEKNGGKSLEKRLHGNLTTMDGLVEYRELVSRATGRSLEETDVIRYDYQLMDDAVWLLHKCGYKLTKKK